MKTKLSFLALPLCLGLALVFALAACDGSTSGPPNGGESSTSNGGGGTSSPESPVYKVNGSDIYVDNSSEKIELMGKFEAAVPAYKMVSLQFNKPGVIYDNRDVGTNIINFDSTQSINMNRGYIPFASIPDCGEKTITATVCHKQGVACGEHTFKYKKPDDYCATSSAGGNVSSSSEAKWKFGARGTLQALNGSENSIPGSSIRFTFTQVGEEFGYTNISVAGGGNARRWTSANCYGNYEDAFDNDCRIKDNYELPGAAFSFETAPRLNNKNDYYLITAGSERYFIRTEGKGGPDGDWDFPMTIQYWKMEGPNL